MAAAIIMSGGRSRRMRESLGPEHKALVQVLGVPMLERNLLTLLSYGFREIFLAINAQEATVLSFARARAAQLAQACNCELKLIVETQPLGTIGAAAEVRTSSEDLLVVNVDNLTTLDLLALLKHHRSSEAAMTVATHTEAFQVPCGQVSAHEGWITRYREKPVLPLRLSSGIYVLSQSARSAIPAGRTVGAPELVNALLDQGHKVAAFEHSSPWIDVNDSVSLRRAERLIMENFTAFELWPESPQRQVAIACVLHDDAGAVPGNGSGAGASVGGWPTVELSGNERPEEAISRCSLPGMLQAKSVRVLVSFDAIDTRTRERTRYHVVVVESARCVPTTAGSGTFREMTDLATMLSDAHGTARTLSYLNRYASDSRSLGH